MVCNLFKRMFKQNTHTCKRTFDGLKKGDRFHFIAIGGVGQSALAKILIKTGYSVSGSDIHESKYTNELKSLGANIFIGHKEENVPEDCFVVVSSAIKQDNPELIRAKELGLTILHRSDVLLQISYEFGLTIGFAGTHGKTTTSGLMSYVMSKMGAAPNFAVGGIIPELNTNADATDDSYVFIAELDESDGTISKYSPDILVINNLEADHLDFYKNGLDDVLDTFKNLILNLPDDAKIIVNIDDDGVLELLKLIGPTDKDIIKFSVKDSNLQNNISCNILADVYALNVEFSSVGSKFDVVYNNKKLGRILTPLKGMHNVYNALAVVCALIETNPEEFDFKDFAPYFKEFTGMGRRFQTVYRTEKIEIIDDYAHHPSEIKATLKAAKEYKEKTQKLRTVAIFQPHRYTRLKALFNEFLESFDDADFLIVLDAYSAGDKFDPEFNSKTFEEKFAKKYKEKSCYIKGPVDEVSNELLGLIKDEDVVLTLGAGDVTKLGKILGESYER